MKPEDVASVTLDIVIPAFVYSMTCLCLVSFTVGAIGVLRYLLEVYSQYQEDRRRNPSKYL